MESVSAQTISLCQTHDLHFVVILFIYAHSLFVHVTITHFIVILFIYAHSLFVHITIVQS